MLPDYFHIWQLPLVFLASLIGESYGSLIGGGSIVTIPVLLFTGLPLQSAIAVDNVAALGTEFGILSQTWQKVQANKWLVLTMAIPMTLGGVVGTWLLIHAPLAVLKYLMAAAVTLVVIHAYIGKQHSTPSATITKANYVLLTIVLFMVGVYSNSVSAGEGTLGKLTLMSVLGFTFLQSQGIKATATIPSRVYMLIAGILAGLIVWPYLIVMWVASFLAGKYATKFAAHLPDRLMKVLLTVVSIILVVYLLVGYKK